MIKQFLMKLFKVSSPSVVLRQVDMSGYSLSMEKYKRKDGNESFELPFVQERYDAIVNALKYTKHSKRRQELLKTKRMYDDILSNRGEVK